LNPQRGLFVRLLGSQEMSRHFVDGGSYDVRS
jgi:hypothetical protein